MREYIEARVGFMLTNGEIYGKRIYLAEGAEKSTFREITDSEYEKLTEENLQPDFTY